MKVPRITPVRARIALGPAVGRLLAGGGQEARRSCENFSYSLFQPSRVILIDAPLFSINRCQTVGPHQSRIRFKASGAVLYGWRFPAPGNFHCPRKPLGSIEAKIGPLRPRPCEANGNGPLSISLLVLWDGVDGSAVSEARVPPEQRAEQGLTLIHLASAGQVFKLCKPFFPPSLCARSSMRQKSFRCESNNPSKSVSFVTGNSTAQGRPFFVITTDRSEGSFFTILLRLALTLRRLSIFTV
jgi:hypothetical protein